MVIISFVHGCYKTANLDRLIEYELSMPSQFEENLNRFCVFHMRDFSILTEEQQPKLVKHHGKALEIKPS